MTSAQGDFLNGKLLLAMPSIGDVRFHRAVILICEHDENGAMGLMLNKPHEQLSLDNFLSDLGMHDGIKIDIADPSFQMFNGGPLNKERAILLHSNDYKDDDTIKVNDDFSISGTLEFLIKILKDDAPTAIRFILGSAGWSAGQLEHEMQDNAWLVACATPEIVFDTAPEDQWSAALKQLGITPEFLTGAAGRA